MIFSEVSGNKISYYFTSIEKFTTDKFTIVRGGKNFSPQFQFTSDPNLITYSYSQKDTAQHIIYDIRFRSRVNIKNSVGIINAYYVSPKSGNVLYEANEELTPVVKRRKEIAGLKVIPPSIYITDAEGDHSRFITDGFAGDWSPDGKWFLVKKPKLYSDFERQRTEVVKRSKRYFPDEKEKTLFDVTQTLWVYSAIGDPLIEFVNYDMPEYIRWSPQSDKLILRCKEDYGFSVIEINETSAGITVKEITHFDNGNPDIDMNDPLISPDGKSILFIRSSWNRGWKQYDKEELCIADIIGENIFSLTSQNERVREYPLWSDDGTILLIRDDATFNNEREVSVVELIIQNIEELFK
ncbi:MAG: PD40 domain-containing protein [Ignavibacteriales bacterium]|nr:PD40 domain-containing protein [Ignavibacteriales bacterium]